MVQVAYAVSLVVAYLPFEQTSNTDHLLRALAVGMVSSIFSCAISSSS